MSKGVKPKIPIIVILTFKYKINFNLQGDLWFKITSSAGHKYYYFKFT